MFGKMKDKMKNKYPSLPFDSEFIKNLRVKIQKNIDDEEFVAFYLFRPFSIYLSYFLYRKTDVTANSITFVMAIYSLMMPVMFVILDVFNNLWILTVLFTLLYFLDVIDGEVARLRNKTSKWGFVLDAVLWYSIPLSYLFFVERLTSSAEFFDFSVKYLSWLAVILHLFSTQIRIIAKVEIFHKESKYIGYEILKFPVTMFGFMLIGLWFFSELPMYSKNLLLSYVLLINVLYILKSLSSLNKLYCDLKGVD